MPKTLYDGPASADLRVFGTWLEGLRDVTANMRINLQLTWEVLSPDPATNTERLRDAILMDDGQTLLVAGPLRKRIRNCSLKLPLLAAYIGSNFIVPYSQEVEEETVLLIKATIVKDR